MRYKPCDLVGGWATILIGAALFGAPVHVAESNELLVGAAQVDITPPVGFRTGGGYGEVVSTGIDDPLYAKALVIRQAQTTAAIVISDLLSVPPDLCRKAEEQIHRGMGIRAENIVLAATHSHGSPEYWGSLRDIARESAVRKFGRDPHEVIDYQAKLVAAWVEAVSQAIAAAQPATVEFVCC